MSEVEWVEIESIELLGEDDTIDICVEDTHCFFANGIYTHNSGFNSDLNDVKTIGKAIEIFQKADQVITFSQNPEMKERFECIAYLLKNRLGLKEIALKCFYNPSTVVFAEIEVVNARVLLSDSAKKKVQATTTNFREKIKMGEYLPKK